MHDLAPLCALGGTAPHMDQVAGVTLAENPGLAIASVTARAGKGTACRSHMADLLGTNAPDVGKAVLRSPEWAFWTGPDQWMIAAPFATHEDIARHLTARFGDSASITEQTDAWVCFDMSGDGIEAVTRLCCNVDIERMQVGEATRTVIHYMGVYLIRTAEDALMILGGRSSAGSLHHALATAMRSAL